MIACGFDAGALDPLGRMLLPAAAFGAMTERLLDAAARLCDGRLVASHEGGYSAGHVPFCGLTVIETLSRASRPGSTTRSRTSPRFPARS